MNKHHIIKETERFVKEKLAGDSSGHDWWHIQRVRQMAERLAEKEKADVWICTMASLLHDLIDDKLFTDVEKAEQEVREFLEGKGMIQKNVEWIMQIIKTISFKGGHGKSVETKEAEIVQDADRLDALGAVGIARTFAFSGAKGQLIYDPEISVRENMTMDDYRNGKSSAIHHFYEKLLLLKDKMNTASGKELAEVRHQRLEQYLEDFLSEWGGRS